MTGEKDSPRILRAWLDRELAKKKQQLTKVNEQLIELERLLAERAKFDQDLDRALNWPKDKPVSYDEKTNRPKYARRPPRWIGRDGYELVSGVLAIQAQDKCKVAAAIRKLKKADPKKWPDKERDLERRFQEAKKYWARWCAINAMLDARLEALLAKKDL
jgi:hypothetical protein